MGEVTVAHRQLGAERAMEVFAQCLGHRYAVYKGGFSTPRDQDFVVKRSAWTAVGVKVYQKLYTTTFVLRPFMPSIPLQVLLGFAGLLPYFLATRVFLRPSWKAMEEEVRSFIENAPELTE